MLLKHVDQCGAIEPYVQLEGFRMKSNKQMWPNKIGQTNLVKQIKANKKIRDADSILSNEPGF